MNGEILSIGTELLMGEITDTNSSYIASQLPALGITLKRISQVGDNLEDLTEALGRALYSADIVFTTGGLGPTQDDMTREAIAHVLQEEMNVDSGLLEDLKAWFSDRGTGMPPRNEKQATLIASAKSIPNDQGTAPGWWVEKDGKIMVAMPGPPSEMRNIWSGTVGPKLKSLVHGHVIITRNIKTTDLAEADVAERVSKFCETANPYLGIYAKLDGIHLRIIARATTEEEASKLIRPVEEGILSIMGSHIWGYDDESPEEVVATALKEKGLTLATMESCTGGMLASTITDVPGSSEYFRGGIVTYSNEAKAVNGVPSELLARVGAISQETAAAMAAAIRERLCADVGIGVTGVAGPSEEEGKAVGTVFVSISLDQGVKNLTLKLPPRRALVKSRSVTTALIELSRYLNQL